MVLAGVTAAGGVTVATPKVTSAGLIDVSCKGSSFCMASGVYDTRQRKGNRLAEQWNGMGWQDVRDPVQGHLVGISCGGARFCFGGTVIRNNPGSAVEWNGRTCQVYKPCEAFGATCGAPKLCMAFANARADIDVWNGKRWKIAPEANACNGGPIPNPDCGYDSLSCGSASDCLGLFHACSDIDCVDGPDEFDSIWNGSGWIGDGVNTPGPGALSCSPGRFCMNVSFSGTVSISDTDEGWEDATPDLATLCTGAQKCSLHGMLSCGASQNCVFMPSRSPLSLLWRNQTWTVVPLAEIAGVVPTLGSLSCGSAINCMAVGSIGTPSRPVAEHWNGTKWQLTKPINH